MSSSNPPGLSRAKGISARSLPAKGLSWDDLNLVLAIAQARGLAPAANRLDVNPSTVFRRLGELERRLGLRLFERHRGGYVPTPAGLDMTALAERMDAEVAALSTKLAGQSSAPSGTLRITTNDAMLTDLLTPVLADFRRRHPALAIEVIVSNDELNLSRRDADIAIRPTDSPPETLVGRRLGRFDWHVYGAAARWRGDPGDSLTETDWVGLTDRFVASPPNRYLAGRIAPENVAYRVNSMLGLAEAVEAGIGIGLLPTFTAGIRGLVRLAEPDPPFATTVWILTHPHLRHAPRVRAFMDFAASAIATRFAAARD